MLNHLVKLFPWTLSALAGALLAWAASCGADAPPPPPKAQCGEILSIEDSTKAEANAGNAVAFVVTAGKDCKSKKRVPISEEVWLNNANCDVGKFYPKCVKDWGEPGIRLPSTPANG
jgi:hypothetical protein